MNFRATRPVTVKCLATVTSCIILLLSLTYSPIEVDITDTQLGMGEQVSFTRFLCCACHARGEGSAFFGTRRAAELHISHSAGCKNACKGVQSVPVLYRDSQRQEDHEAGPVGAPGHWPARPVSIASAKRCLLLPDIRIRYPISVCMVFTSVYKGFISVYTDVKH